MKTTTAEERLKVRQLVSRQSGSNPKQGWVSSLIPRLPKVNLSKGLSAKSRYSGAAVAVLESSTRSPAVPSLNDQVDRIEFLAVYTSDHQIAM